MSEKVYYTWFDRQYKTMTAVAKGINSKDH